METQELLMKQENPPRSKSRAKGKRKVHTKTQVRRQQLQDNPGVWFIYSESAKHQSTAGSALETLEGISNTGGRLGQLKKRSYEVATRKNEDGTFKIYVRYSKKATKSNG